MKPELRQIKKQPPGLDENFIREHFERLENRYFDRFDTGQIGEHLEIAEEVQAWPLLKAVRRAVAPCGRDGASSVRVMWP